MVRRPKPKSCNVVKENIKTEKMRRIIKDYTGFDIDKELVYDLFEELNKVK